MATKKKDPTMKKKELVLIAEEMNEQMTLDPQIDPTVAMDVLTEGIKKEADEIDLTIDTYTADCEKAMKKMGIWPNETGAPPENGTDADVDKKPVADKKEEKTATKSAKKDPVKDKKKEPVKSKAKSIKKSSIKSCILDAVKKAGKKGITMSDIVEADWNTNGNTQHGYVNNFKKDGIFSVEKGVITFIG